MGGIADSLFPGDGGKSLSLVVADHGLSQTGGKQTRIVQEVPAIKAFQAQGALVCYAFGRFGTEDTVIFDDKV